MPIARIVTRFPERAAALRKTLLDSGYRVEVLRPEEALQGEADIQYDIDDMPEYAGTQDPPAEREFIFAPQWRALIAHFGKAEKPADQAAPKPIEPSVSYARLEERREEKSVDHPAQGPTLIERLHAMRGPLVEKLHSARQEFDEKRRQLAQQVAERRAAADEARRLREIELTKKREADRAAEEAREAREAQRLAEVQAQMALRRKEEEQARLAAQQRAQAEAERNRLAAEQHARIEAERIRAAAIARQAAPASISTERRRGFREIVSAAFQNLGDWREPYASTHFVNTRVYALRQYAPIAAGIALAFFLGWAIAVGGARQTSASNPPVKLEAATSAPVPAAIVVPPVKASKPSAAPQKATTTKPKAQVRRFRRPPQDDEVVWKNGDHGGDDDVTVIHHYPGKSNLARSGKKNGVKTISDLEQN